MGYTSSNESSSVPSWQFRMFFRSLRRWEGWHIDHCSFGTAGTSPEKGVGLWERREVKFSWRSTELLKFKVGVSKNRDTPKWMVCNGKPYQNGWFGGTPIFRNTQVRNSEYLPESIKPKTMVIVLKRISRSRSRSHKCMRHLYYRCNDIQYCYIEIVRMHQ